MRTVVAAVVYLAAEGDIPHGVRLRTSRRRCSTLACSAVSRTTAQSICQARFALCNWWTWTYRDAQGGPSSWERYTVVAVADTTLVIEMASKFEDADPFRAHHRMTLDVAESLAARGGSGQWALRRFSFRDADDAWRTAPHRDNVQVFEEKFDCFAMLPLPARPRAVASRSSACALLRIAVLCGGSRCSSACAQCIHSAHQCTHHTHAAPMPCAVAHRTLSLPAAVGGGPGVRALCCQVRRGTRAMARIGQDEP